MEALKLLLTSSRPSDQTLAMMQALFKEDEVDLEWISYPGIGGFLVLDDMTYASVTTAKAVIDLRWERVSEKDSKDAPTYTELFTKHQTPFGWIIGMQIRLSKANRFSMGEKEQAQKEMRIEEWACQIIDTHLNRPKRPIEELYCSNFSEEGRHYRCWKNTKWAN